MELPIQLLVITGLIVLIIILVGTIIKLTTSYHRLRSVKRGDEVRRGFMTEQWLPLIEPYPWNPQNLRFLGNPIDGIQFEDDMLIFVEFKSGASQLSAKQRHIRALIQAGKVEFKEVRVRTGEKGFERLEVK